MPSDGVSFSISRGSRRRVSMVNVRLARSAVLSALENVGAGCVAKRRRRGGWRDKCARAVGEPALPIEPPGALVMGRGLGPSVGVDVRGVGRLREHLVGPSTMTGLAD